MQQKYIFLYSQVLGISKIIIIEISQINDIFEMKYSKRQTFLKFNRNGISILKNKMIWGI